jgi:hypothetical protein
VADEPDVPHPASRSAIIATTVSSLIGRCQFMMYPPYRLH